MIQKIIQKDVHLLIKILVYLVKIYNNDSTFIQILFQNKALIKFIGILKIKTVSAIKNLIII